MFFFFLGLVTSNSKINVHTHTSTRTRIEDKVASLSCTLIPPSWMEKNSVAMEKGTLNTQCMYKQKQKKNLSTRITLLEDQEQWPKKQNQQNCKPSLNGAKKKKKRNSTNETRRQKSRQYKYIQNIFLLSTTQYLEMQFHHLDRLRQQRAIPQIELHNMSQYLRSNPSIPPSHRPPPRCWRR